MDVAYSGKRHDCGIESSIGQYQSRLKLATIFGVVVEFPYFHKHMPIHMI